VVSVRILVNSLRLAAVIAIVIAVVAQLQHSVASGLFNPFNFFGYFTIQSNVIVAVVFFIAVVVAARRKQGKRLQFARGAATVYIAITGLVFNTLLVQASLAGSFDLQWASDIMHKIIPVYAVLDWLLFSDRAKLGMRAVLGFLVYPLVWLVVVLIRGATDGWVPYPFLNPSLGYGVVAAYCVGIAVAFALVGVLVVGMSRLRLIKV
jgi:hypothetical protein